MEVRMGVFNPSEHLISLKNGKSEAAYLEVKWRLVWFRDCCPQGTIATEMLLFDPDKEFSEEAYIWNNEKRHSEKVIKNGRGIAVFRATVTDGQGGSATGTKSERGVSFGDYLEKAESGAIGRALAALGYGTQFTGDELSEGHRIVDSPVARPEQRDQQPAPHVPSVADLKALCDEVVGPGKWGSVRGRFVDPAQFGDVPDEMLSDKQLADIHAALLARQKARAKAGTAGGGR
jgi:hypothetical protein